MLLHKLKLAAARGVVTSGSVKQRMLGGMDVGFIAVPDFCASQVRERGECGNRDRSHARAVAGLNGYPVKLGVRSHIQQFSPFPAAPKFDKKRESRD
jgi:hypothetical protein